ncbi:MAG: alpha/beta hydrolase, partial [Deltaproteobacteria bacterium]|nr:alpha/beta hydrolase [Deltaproteobacteria bacterium]
MPTAEIGDIKLNYEDSGQGEPILLVPPSWWPAATWKVAVVPALRQSYRTVIFDCRGTGGSSKPKYGYTVQQFADDGIALLSHLGISRVHAVGFALGGQIVQAMAIARP